MLLIVFISENKKRKNILLVLNHKISISISLYY